jgi:FkbM family methyltransferase
MLESLRSARGVFRSLRIYYGDKERSAAMDRLYRRFISPGDLVFDIGAHVGDRVAAFRRLDARVVALEPQPALARTLRLLYGRDPNVTIEAAAAGARLGSVELSLNIDNPTVSTASPDFIDAAAGAPGWQGQAWVKSLRVPLTTIDALIAEYGAPAFIKIDVEGFEAEVLAGLTAAVPALSFEFTTIQRDVARACIEQCVALGCRQFNAVLGESQAFEHVNWIDADAIAGWLAELPAGVNSADVYACLGSYLKQDRLERHHHPHAEEPRSGVSKHRANAADFATSFETRSGKSDVSDFPINVDLGNTRDRNRSSGRGVMGLAAVGAHIPSSSHLLRNFVIAAGLGASLLFIIVGLAAELQMFGDGSIFSYAVAAQHAWAFHWHNISGRLFSYVFAYVPAETFVALTKNASAGIFIYGLLHFSAPLLALLATWAADRTPGRIVFVYACLSTACLCPLVFGFPTEMWMAHALFWPTLALSLCAPRTAAGNLAMFAALLALIFTHEGALVLAAAILFALFLRGWRDPLFLRALGAFLAAVPIWLIVKLAIPPDDYISGVLGSAAYRFFDIGNLEQPVLFLLIGALWDYMIAVFVLRRLGAAAPFYAALLPGAALVIYWLWFDTSLLTDARYELRTVLLIATSALGLAASVHTMGEKDRRKSPARFLTPFAMAIEKRLDPRIILGAIALILLVHVVETAKFVRAWTDYKSAIRTLATGMESDPALGSPLFVASKRLSADLNRLAWNSTMPYLSVLVAPGHAPNRLVVDLDTGYFWLSCEIATRSEQTSTAIPLQARELIRQYSCLHRS